MTNEPRSRYQKQSTYTILFKGIMSRRWTDWFGNMTILDPEGAGRPGCCLVTVEVHDQSALLGVLQKLHNLGYTLVEIRAEDRKAGDLQGGKDESTNC